LIEGSVNSVRVSLKLKELNDFIVLLIGRFSNFFKHRAEEFEIVRKVPLKGYDISFLICDFHLEKYKAEVIIETIMEFIKETS